MPLQPIFHLVLCLLHCKFYVSKQHMKISINNPHAIYNPGVQPNFPCDATRCPAVDSPSKQYNINRKQCSHGKNNRHTHLRLRHSDGRVMLLTSPFLQKTGMQNQENLSILPQWKQTWWLLLWKWQRMWQEAEVFTNLLFFIVFMLH